MRTSNQHECSRDFGKEEGGRGLETVGDGFGDAVDTQQSLAALVDLDTGAIRLKSHSQVLDS